MRKCELCGANLDPQEKCDCREEAKENEVKAYEETKAHKSHGGSGNSDISIVLDKIRRLKAELNSIRC